jgi:hypothetical protein
MRKITVKRKKPLSFVSSQIYLHGNNLSTLHEHLPTDILPAELGGTGPAFNPGLWAEPVIHSAMKEAELAAAAAAAAKKGKEQQIDASEQELASLQDGSETTNGSYRRRSDGSNMDKTFFNKSSNAAMKRSFAKTTQMEVELNVINERRETQEEFTKKNDSAKERLVHVERVSDEDAEEKRHSDNRTNEHKDNTVLLDAEVDLNEFEMIPNKLDNKSDKDSLLDNRLEKRALIVNSGNNEIPSEETNLIT